MSGSSRGLSESWTFLSGSGSDFRMYVCVIEAEIESSGSVSVSFNP